MNARSAALVGNNNDKIGVTVDFHVNMESYKITALAVMVVTWIELLIAALVVFLDPVQNHYPYTTIMFTWPAVLEQIHRFWALVLVLVFLANLITVFLYGPGGAKYLRSLSIAATLLLVLQSILGGVTIFSSDNPVDVILHEGNAGILMLVSALLAAYALYFQPRQGSISTQV